MMRHLTRTLLATAALATGTVLAAQGAGPHAHGQTGAGAARAHGNQEHAAIGRPGDPRAATRTVEVVLDDIAFSPAAVTVRDGETVRFVLHNRGKLLHEFNIGTPPMHREHQAEMQAMFEQGLMTPTGMPGHMDDGMPGHGRGHMDEGMPGHGRGHMDERSHEQMAKGMHGHAGDASRGPGGMDHDDPNSVLLVPGETKELVWTFERSPALEFACNVPGHYPAGMVGKFEFE